MNTLEDLQDYASSILDQQQMEEIARKIASHMRLDEPASAFELGGDHDRFIQVASHYINEWYFGLSHDKLVSHLVSTLTVPSAQLTAMNMLWAESCVHLVRNVELAEAIQQYRKAWCDATSEELPDRTRLEAACRAVIERATTTHSGDSTEYPAAQSWLYRTGDSFVYANQALKNASGKFIADRLRPVFARALRVCFPSPWESDDIATVRRNYPKAACIVQQAVRESL